MKNRDQGPEATGKRLEAGAGEFQTSIQTRASKDRLTIEGELQHDSKTVDTQLALAWTSH